MLEEFQSQLMTLNYFWLAGAVLFGFFAGRIFKKGTVPMALLAYIGFVYPTMKFGDILQTLGFSSSFTQAANSWGLAPWDLASACVAGLVVLIMGVFWALNQ